MWKATREIPRPVKTAGRWGQDPIPADAGSPHDVLMAAHARLPVNPARRVSAAQAQVNRPRTQAAIERRPSSRRALGSPRTQDADAVERWVNEGGRVSTGRASNGRS